jgi:hypothetical protein
MRVGHSYKNDRSLPLRDMRPIPYGSRHHEAKHELENERLAIGHHQNARDSVVQRTTAKPNTMPSPVLNFDGIGFPGVACSCAPPDTNGEVGATQYVQDVNDGYQVFNKFTGASVFGPVDIATIWSGFGGNCELVGDGDPVVVYDQLANRWVVTQFAGSPVPTDECIAVSTSSDASGSYNRYAFHLGTHFFDYPKFGVWPDAYYMSMNVFSETDPNPYLGPQPFAFDRTAMLAGTAATFQTPGITGGATEETYLPADLDGSTAPPTNAPNSFVEWGTSSVAYKVFHFHVDWTTPASSTFTLFASPPVAAFTVLCPVSACVPQLGSADNLDSLSDRLMFRAAYRNFGDHESLVSTYSVSSGGIGAPRWFELRGVTAGPVTVAQESTYQPDTTYRWMGSAAMDKNGDLALGYSASSATLHPEIRYAGRLATDTVNTLGQGETNLIDQTTATGSQIGTGHRWGDYSDMTVDPVDDCTFWYTTEYYATTAAFAWKTRIGNFKFPSCTSATLRLLTVTKAGTGAGTVTSSPSGISCGGSCAAQFSDGASVTLTAAASTASTFTGWSGGGCSGTGTCTVTMDANKTVTATFESDKTLTVAKAGSGTGTVTSGPAGIDCGATCTHAYVHGTSVTLTATASTGSSFAGWSGDCSGTTCVLTMSADHTATATFETDKTLTAGKSGDGAGSISSSPAGISCGATCSHAFTHGTSVTLTASPTSTSQFAGWSGDCTGTTCVLTMSADHTATATFLAKCIVPKVKGKKLAAAKSALRKKHCAPGKVTKAFSSKKKGTVISQKPGPGTKLARGGKVNLKVSKGKKKK